MPPTRRCSTNGAPSASTRWTSSPPISLCFRPAGRKQSEIGGELVQRVDAEGAPFVEQRLVGGIVAGNRAAVAGGEAGAQFRAPDLQDYDRNAESVGLFQAAG